MYCEVAIAEKLPSTVWAGLSLHTVREKLHAFAAAVDPCIVLVWDWQAFRCLVRQDSYRAIRVLPDVQCSRIAPSVASPVRASLQQGLRLCLCGCLKGAVCQTVCCFWIRPGRSRLCCGAWPLEERDITHNHCQHNFSLRLNCRAGGEGCSCALASGLPERELQVGHRV